jgi:hypothetical protein
MPNRKPVGPVFDFWTVFLKEVGLCLRSPPCPLWQVFVWLLETCLTWVTLPVATLQLDTPSFIGACYPAGHSLS